MTAQRSGSAIALGDVINESMKAPPEVVQAPPAAPVVQQPVETPARKAKAAPATEWRAQAKVKPLRRQLNVGLPVELDLHYRLAMFAAQTGIDAQDATAEALHVWLTGQGVPLDPKRRGRE